MLHCELTSVKPLRSVTLHDDDYALGYNCLPVFAEVQVDDQNLSQVVTVIGVNHCPKCGKGGRDTYGLLMFCYRAYQVFDFLFNLYWPEEPQTNSGS